VEQTARPDEKRPRRWNTTARLWSTGDARLDDGRVPWGEYMGIRKFIAALGAAAVAVSLAVVAGPPAPASAVTASDFDPGYIISDERFFDRNAMSEAQIQAFLQAQIGACANTNCLNVKRLDTTTRGADLMCGRYEGAANEPASRVIYKVAQACGINPQVLMVMLHKEQSLITGPIAKAPTASRLDRAMGYACPDNTAQPGWCDPSFGGLYNQLYKAAWQFKRYANPPGTSKAFTRYSPGSRAVQYNPNAACGSSVINIRNQATSNLYFYTPYQPNRATIAAKFSGGSFDYSCGAYGNINFFIFFNQWFGSSTGPVSPFGNVEVTAGLPDHKVRVTGWAIDPGTKSPIDVHVYVGSAGTARTANLARSDIGAAYPSSGPNHGFDVTVDAPVGTSKVCVYAINSGAGGNVQLACRTVTVPGGSPIGALDSAVPDRSGAITVTGWTVDPDVTSAIPVHVYVDSTGTAFTANTPRADIGRIYPAYGQGHGFSATVKAGPGTHNVCAYGINSGAGGHTQLGCKTVTVSAGLTESGRAPIGHLDNVSVDGQSVSVSGWTLDPDTTAAIPVHIYVGDAGVARTAGNARPDIARAYPTYGAGHGFAETVPATPGTHKVCAYGINTAAGGHTLLGCETVTVNGVGVSERGRQPIGNVEKIAVAAKRIDVAGWALDPDSAKSVAVHVYIDGVGQAFTANEVRSDIGRVYPAYGDRHGFSEAITATPGAHDVCVYAINGGPGGHVQMACKTVTVPSA
jgi:hypothetical protein